MFISAWYSSTDDDWNGRPRVKAAIEAWLDVSNFVEGKQKQKLEEFRLRLEVPDFVALRRVVPHASDVDKIMD